MAVYFTSDTHFYHTNIIGYCKRPFLNPDGSPAVWYMNEVLVDNWNSVVGPQDTIYHLGDFAFGSKTLSAQVLSKLNGYKVLIKGNHDRKADTMVGLGFNEVHRELFLEQDGVKLYLHHEPMPEEKHVWSRRADFHLCGHIHQLWLRQGRTINVGVDVWDLKPQPLDRILSAE